MFYIHHFIVHVLPKNIFFPSISDRQPCESFFFFGGGGYFEQSDLESYHI